MSVKNECSEYVEYKPKWERCRDATDGQDAIHKADQKYLPALKNQRQDDYLSYLKRANFYNASGRTVDGLCGMLFRKPSRIDVPASVEPLLEDVSLDGTPFQVFVIKTAKETLTTGRLGILVDFPPAVAVTQTQADAQLLNLRPTMGMYKAESIINWRTTQINNKTVLSMVVLVEKHHVARDEFTNDEETRYRVLDLSSLGYRVRVFRIGKDGRDEQIGEDVFPTIGGKQMDFVPFYFIGVTDTHWSCDCPPLLDLVDLNLSHYRTTADYEHGCHFTALPTAVVSGWKDELGDDLYIGSQTAWCFPDSTAHASFLEFSGAGLAALKDNLTRKEEQMAVLGARMLESQKAGIEAVGTAALHRSGEASLLAASAMSISLGVTAALQVFSDWSGASGDVTFEINRDFLPMPMDPSELSALVSAWQQGAISKVTLFRNLKEGEVIAEEITFEDEEAAIAEDDALRREQQQLQMDAYNQAQIDLQGAQGGGGQQ